MEYTSIKLDYKLAIGKIKAMHNAYPTLTHMICADDVLIFMKVDTNDAKVIKTVF